MTSEPSHRSQRLRPVPSAPPGRRRVGEDTITAAIAGDLAAFEALVRTHDDSLRVLAYRLLGERANDALQDAYLRAFRAIQRFDYRGDAESAVRIWLHRIVYRVCMDHVRQGGRLADLVGESQLMAASPATEEAAIASVVVRRALSELGPDSRTVLVLVEILGLDYREAGEIIGISTGTVASRLHTARNQMRSALRDYKEM